MASSDCYTTPWLLGVMDILWFHKIVLCSQPICSSSNSSSSSESQPSSNSSSAPTDYSDDDTTEEFSHGGNQLLLTISTTPQNDSEDEDDKKERLEEEKNIKESLTPTRLNQATKKTKPSSTPTRRRIIKTRPRLERTLSCKTLAELEQEEVKGFMDLGFIFDKDRLTPRMMSVLPGLQRLEGQDYNDGADGNGQEEEEEDEEELKMVGRGVQEGKRRPYLSEAWMIKRPDSPLLRLRMCRVSTTSSDMKKHLKLWAKTVANSAIQQHP